MRDFDLSKITGYEPPLENEPCEFCVEQNKIWTQQARELCKLIDGEDLDWDIDPMDALRESIIELKAGKVKRIDMTKKYEHRFQFVEGMLESDMEMRCIGGARNDPVYHLCLRNTDGTGMYVTIATIRLHTKDLYVDAKAVEKSTIALGNEIALRWNTHPNRFIKEHE
jgi:hypothetical protein